MIDQERSQAKAGSLLAVERPIRPGAAYRCAAESGHSIDNRSKGLTLV
jgi:hypothetical protein